MIGFRTQKIEALEILPREFIKATSTMSSNDKIKFMITKLIYSPDKTFFWLIVEKDKIVGFLFAFLVEIGNYCFIQHAEVDKKVPVIMTKKAFIALEEFCRNNNCKTIQMQTVRNPIAFGRKYGFEVIATVMSKDIGD